MSSIDSLFCTQLKEATLHPAIRGQFPRFESRFKASTNQRAWCKSISHHINQSESMVYDHAIYGMIFSLSVYSKAKFLAGLKLEAYKRSNRDAAQFSLQDRHLSPSTLQQHHHLSPSTLQQHHHLSLSPSTSEKSTSIPTPPPLSLSLPLL